MKITDIFKKKSSSDVAKDRLKLVLVSDRASCSPEIMQKIRSDIIEVLSKYAEIDMDGNCILVGDKRRAHKDFVKAIKKLVDNPELITTLQNNMYDTVKDKYNIRNVTDKRAAWYKEIVQLKKGNV